MSNREHRVLSLCGFLGYGFPKSSLDVGLSHFPDVVGVDNGSTDPGPYYLGSGKSLIKPAQLKRDLSIALNGSRQLQLPFVVGSAGTAGGEPHVDSVLKILKTISREQRHTYRLAIIRSDLDKEFLKTFLKSGKIHPMGQIPELTERELDLSTRVVGQMGVAPFIEAFEGGADVIIAGRSCDTAIFASMAIMKGFDPGLAYHMAKIIECGAQCAIPTGTNDSIIAKLRDDHFELEAVNHNRRLTPTSVAAHMLYEQPEPHRFYEPEGVVDLSDVRMKQIDDRKVMVYGSKFHASEQPTIKIEGAKLVGYRSISIAGIVDPILISHLEDVQNDVAATVDNMLLNSVGTYSLRFINYGKNGVSMAPLSQDKVNAGELGGVIEVIADDQDTSDAVLALTRSTFLHSGFKGRKATGGNLAFPFSPSDFAGGPVYEFNVYHLMEVDDPKNLFTVEFEDINYK